MSPPRCDGSERQRGGGVDGGTHLGSVESIDMHSWACGYERFVKRNGSPKHTLAETDRLYKSS